MRAPTFESNELIDRLPKHLKQFIKPQEYDSYTPIDQAVWRYVMRRLVRHLSVVAHESYIRGLEMTGVGVESIPSMYGMNRILKDIGWAAVAVDGFIPPNAFMEFQAYKVLVIASDMRQLENIQYTPAPDIIHESAGHAPIIANPDYAEYLRRLGEIGARAILSRHDMEVYEAVRSLSILKEARGTSQSEIDKAEELVTALQSKEVELSEMAMMRNLQWWSVEYGLIGTLEDPKIYGAGLLSSIGESLSCLQDDVTKLPYTISAAYREFDVTRPQPQLYVTPDFSHLMQVLEEFANTLSLRGGGSKGVQKLIESQMVGSIELNTGLQVTGRFSRVLLDDDKRVIFFETEGPTALAFREKELIGHGVEQHTDGFSSPLGRLKNINLAIEEMGPVDLKAYNFYDNKWLSFEFESGIRVEGLNVTGIRNIYGKLMLIELVDCTVVYGEEELFTPDQGTYYMLVGSEIVSAFAGSADHRSFPNLYHESSTLTIQPDATPAKRQLEVAYATIRQHREEGLEDEAYLRKLFGTIRQDHPSEWLLLVEMLEIVRESELSAKIVDYLTDLAQSQSHLRQLIEDGIQLIEEA